ncbi:DNA repair protein RecN [Marispirochaeta aestuarii]|uniref:DNA repair protein RecN n=1 Tax=Marispirochaeta aestuarii TaxID=1963862 RepID=UPI0029C96BED|nr:DNA repair protein RecN [Marispirochaeta aestuarii]
MLEELRIENFALIDSINIRFSRGLNILTGETGAGKSIIVGALGAILGDKADTGVIRSHADEARISGVLLVDHNPDALAWLSEHDIVPEEGTVIVRRVIRRNGRGSVFLQDSQIPRATLQEFTSLLFDMHGQHEHQSLLQVDQHRKLLDSFAGIENQVSQLASNFSELTRLRREYDSMNQAEREQLRELDFLNHAIEEIDAAHLKPGEEESLQEELEIISQAEKIYSHLEEFSRLSSESRGGAIGYLRKARDELSFLTGIVQKLEPLLGRFESAFLEMEDIVESVRAYNDEVQFSPGRLDEIEQRLMQIRRLEKKYGDSIEEVLQYREDSAAKINSIDSWQERKEEMEQQLSELNRKIGQIARSVSESRRQVAGNLKAAVEERIRPLGMQKAVFSVQVEPRTGENGKTVCGPSGTDQVEFLIAPNQGEPLKPLRTIASGGELSRLMLAIKTVLSEADQIDSLIFDEIDTGIGGEVGLALGEQLSLLAERKQILCITHLASVAVRADNHIVVTKEIEDGRTITHTRSLSEDERVTEIARMLSGDPVGAASISHARELIGKYPPKAGLKRSESG